MDCRALSYFGILVSFKIITSYLPTPKEMHMCFPLIKEYDTIFCDSFEFIAYATSQLRRGKKGKVGGILNLILIDKCLALQSFNGIDQLLLEMESCQHRTEEHDEMASPSPQ